MLLKQDKFIVLRNNIIIHMDIINALINLLENNNKAINSIRPCNQFIIFEIE